MAENGVEDLDWSKEHDCVPLKLRLKSLRANKCGIKSRNRSEDTSKPPFAVVKNEDQQYDPQKDHPMKVPVPACFALKEGNQKLPQGESHNGLPGESSYLTTENNESMNSNIIKLNEVPDTITEEKVDPCLNTSPTFILLKCSGKEVEHEDNVKNPLRNGNECSLISVGQVAKLETENEDDFLDDLDFIVLKERRRLLLLRNLVELAKPISEGNCSTSSDQGCSNMVHKNHGTGKNENFSTHAESSSGKHHSCDVPKRNSHDSAKISESASPFGNAVAIEERDKTCLSDKASTMNKFCGTCDTLSSPVLSEMSSNVKDEPMEYESELDSDKGVCTFVSNDLKSVKSEFPEDFYGDKVDHMLLSDRIKQLASKEISKFSRVFKSSKTIVPSVQDYSPLASESIPSVKINRPRKRKRTITDSIETAMEEDAPGLLKVLIDKGVSVDEIKLYGVAENGEAPDNSLEESFSELEAVISKLFFQRRSVLKFASMRCMKDEKPSYCLACLVSLVEQARYLGFRKWPVEWGWCRDLQSFIFVFQKHHRIVLERPEYGYATYFFELVDSFTIDWQIKRLITAMKLTSCGRITLIEDRTLLVGEDLTEGEARVLMDYGWTPSSGLGTMLMYRDRVVHDRRNESASSEWKSKIGKLLMEGYNGGTFVSPQIPKKVVEFGAAEDVHIKLEI